MKKIIRGCEKIEEVIINLCAIFLCIIIFIIVFQVVARRLNISLSGTEELARYSYVIFVFLLWPVAARRGKDLRITVAFDLLSDRAREIVMAVFHIFMAIFSVMCIYSTWVSIKTDMLSHQVLPSNRWLHLSTIHGIILATLVLTFAGNVIRSILLFAGEEKVLTQAEENEQEMKAESEKIERELAKEAAKAAKGGAR